MSVPGGRSVSMLVNATPIGSGSGEVGSFVVTMQDLTDLEELEWLRAEFLAMVSHELREPLTSIKGSITTLLEAATALDAAEVVQFPPDHQLPDGPDAGDDQRPAGRGPASSWALCPSPRNRSRWRCWWRMPAAPSRRGGWSTGCTSTFRRSCPG